MRSSLGIELSALIELPSRALPERRSWTILTMVWTCSVVSPATFLRASVTAPTILSIWTLGRPWSQLKGKQGVDEGQSATHTWDELALSLDESGVAKDEACLGASDRLCVDGTGRRRDDGDGESSQELEEKHVAEGWLVEFLHEGRRRRSGGDT